MTRKQYEEFVLWVMGVDGRITHDVPTEFPLDDSPTFYREIARLEVATRNDVSAKTVMLIKDESPLFSPLEAYYFRHRAEYAYQQILIDIETGHTRLTEDAPLHVVLYFYICRVWDLRGCYDFFEQCVARDGQPESGQPPPKITLFVPEPEDTQ